MAPSELETAASLIPSHPTFDNLRRRAASCTACPLYANATQTVFGEGPADARLMLVGETPGDVEDRTGRPFVGPAGRLLDRCLAEVGIDRDQAYVSNAVKHFKWTPRGKRRLHAKPNAREIRACFPWLQAEIALVKPEIVVCLGATAAKALIGPDFRVSHQRGELVSSPYARFMLATVHPSALLRTEPEMRDAEITRFVADLKKVAKLLRRL